MALLTIRKSTSITNFIVQVLDFIAICLGGWMAYQFRFANGGEWAVPSSDQILLVLILAGSASLFFSTVYRMWPGGGSGGHGGASNAGLADQLDVSSGCFDVHQNAGHFFSHLADYLVVDYYRHLMDKPCPVISVDGTNATFRLHA